MEDALNIVILRATDVNPDSRVEKETYSLKQKGHNVHIIGWDRSSNHAPVDGYVTSFGQKTSITRFGIKGEYGAGGKNTIIWFKFQFFMFRWLLVNRKRYECIHACDFNTAFTGFIVAKILNKKIVYDIFDYFVDSYAVPYKLKELIRKIDELIIHKADAVIVCTEQRIEQINFHGDITKVYVIHNSPMEINGGDYASYDGEKLRIVYVGVLQPDRYLKELLEVVAKHDDYELHIGGFGLLEPFVLDMAKRYDNIKYYGKISYDQTLELEKTANVLTALYKYNEAHKYAAPNKFYEALMLGKPLIMAKNTGVDNVVSDNKIGIVIGRDVDSLEDALEKIMAEKSHWPKISSKMIALFREKYSWNIMEKRLFKLYESI